MSENRILLLTIKYTVSIDLFAGCVVKFCADDGAENQNHR
ncbi:hypothetical protein HMPREF9996_01480 [Aggregatibacter actinomycetemcomitans Y4]|nr:hypothetical protein HMPREF9996_01480 [Aggregatibacter actinomycetemcomitans Y4]